MVAARSQNGWPALTQDSKLLYTWVIPARNGEIKLRCRNGSAGFLLAYFALWFAEGVQPLKGKIADDWGWAYRPVRGETSGLSNHAAGCAIDLNAEKHPLAKTGTFSKAQVAKVHVRLRFLRGCIRWGGDYHGRKDEMHFEIVQTLPYCERIARMVMRVTPRGRRILKANPSQKAVILS